MMNDTLSQKVNVTPCDDDTSELVGTRMFFGVFASLAVTEDADTASIPIAQSPLGFLALPLSVHMDACSLVRWFFPSQGVRVGSFTFTMSHHVSHRRMPRGIDWPV